MNFDPTWLMFMLLSSGLGMIYLNFGRKNSRMAFALFGVALMVDAYFFSSALGLGLSSAALAAGPFLVRRFIR